jgi:PKD repeat protein
MDGYDQLQQVSLDTSVTVSAPSANTAPVAHFTSSCANNVCTIDGRSSTDENASTLTYAWNFGNTRTGTGPLAVHTYTGPGTFTVTLVATDEYGVPSAPVTGTVTIATPPGNVAPTAVISTPSCVSLVCNFSGQATVDSNVGDTVTYLWNFGDATPTSTQAAPAHTFPAAGTYTVTLTATDGWGAAQTVTRAVTVTSP